MKKIFFSSFLLLGSLCFSQTMTEKYNSLNSRYEYYDSSGNMIAYKKYNNLSGQWEYYTSENYRKQQSYQYKDPQQLDISNIGNGASILQNRYDNNQQKIQAAVDDIVYKIKALNLPETKKSQIIQDFTDTLTKNMGIIYSGLNSTSQTNSHVSWLYDVANTIIKNSK